MEKALGILLAIGVGIFIAYQAITGIGHWLATGGGAVVFIIVTAIGGIILLIVLISKYRSSKAFEGLPDAGPMKLNIRVEEIPAKLDFRLQSGSNIAQRMHIDFTISKKDLLAFKQLGLIGNELFSHRHPRYPDVMVELHGSSSL